MAITQLERTQIQKVFIAMLNAAPSVTYLDQLVGYAGRVDVLARDLAETSAFNALYPASLTDQEFANRFVANFIGSTASADAQAYVADEVVKSLAAGVSRADTLFNVVVALQAVADGDATFGNTKKAFENKVAVANYYAIEMGGTSTDLVVLTNLIAGVTPTTDVSTPEAIEAVIDATPAGTTGQTFTLTTGSDTGAAFTGGSGNDTFSANVTMAADGLTLVDTLQSIDALTGGAGTDTLNVTLNNAGATPTLNGVEIVNLRATGATDLNLSAATGVTNVNVANSTAVATLTSVGTAAVGVANQKQNVNINGSTATGLTLNLDTVGTAATDITVDLGSATANAATSFAITAKDAHVTFTETTASAATTSATVAATGANELTFAAADRATLTSVSVTGAGSVDFTGATLTALKTLTVADGGVKATINNQTAGQVTVTTGAGVDTVAVSGAGLLSLSAGAGNDAITVGNAAQATLATAVAAAANAAAVGVLTTAAVTAGTITAAQKTTIDTAAGTSVAAAATAATTIATAGGVVAATATVDLGAGDDSLTLGSAFAAGATLTGGDGTDTLGMAKADYATVAAYSAANLAKVTGFETLSITNALATGDSIDVSKIAGITSFKAAAGVTTGNTAAATNLGAASTVELAGAAANNGQLTVSLKTDTAADSMTVKFNKDFADNNNTTADVNTASQTVVAADIESLTVNSTGKQTATFTAVDGYKADTITNTLTLTGSDKLTSITVTGDQKLVVASTAAMTKLATVNASANTGGLSFDGSLANMTTPTTSVEMTITGSATAANTLVGTGHADTITGGAKADTITGGLGADALNGGAGNDTFVYNTAGESTLVSMDVITGFSANTYGNGTSGAAGTGAAADAAKWTGDVLKFDAAPAQVTAGAVVSVQANAGDAQTFLQNLAADATANEFGVALDSSSGKLYIDWDSNGTADSVITLTGVTAITAAAIQLV